MRRVALIAANFVREQRIFLILLVAYVLLGGVAILVSGERPGTEDILFLVKQHASYAIFFGIALASSAIYNERKSRRILAVLSKAVTRREYLAGLILGSSCVLWIYLLALAVGGVALFVAAGLDLQELFGALLLAATATLLAASVTIFYCTFLHPWLALTATMLTLTLPPLFSIHFGATASMTVPAYELLLEIFRWGAESGIHVNPMAVTIAVGEITFVWLAAARIFSYRDVAVAVE
jgi:ABC-type transport system involved in multi-copper enzyme maturation permease subunit